jgi:hypothetical protein
MGNRLKPKIADVANQSTGGRPGTSKQMENADVDQTVAAGAKY